MKAAKKLSTASAVSQKNDLIAQKRYSTLGGSITDQIETQIVEGQLKPGEKLDEVLLGNQLSVSRTPIREALRVLAAKGLVEFRPRIGAIVACPTVGDVMDLFELVAELEGVAARLAAERMTDEDKQRIVDAHAACQTAAVTFDPQKYYETNGEFHAAIRHAAHNKMLFEQTELLDKRLSPYRRFITFQPDRTETALREHVAVYNAIMARKGDSAEQAMRDHVQVLAEESLALAKSLRF
ncbi:GntR family transcriptional regulator [Brucella tritici]|nr:GntR family transcriptional regulator [Brucella tritici]